jgi:hypothetical protein
MPDAHSTFCSRDRGRRHTALAVKCTLFDRRLCTLFFRKYFTVRDGGQRVLGSSVTYRDPGRWQAALAAHVLTVSYSIVNGFVLTGRYTPFYFVCLSFYLFCGEYLHPGDPGWWQIRQSDPSLHPTVLVPMSLLDCTGLGQVRPVRSQDVEELAKRWCVSPAGASVVTKDGIMACVAGNIGRPVYGNFDTGVPNTADPNHYVMPRSAATASLTTFSPVPGVQYRLRTVHDGRHRTLA